MKQLQNTLLWLLAFIFFLCSADAAEAEERILAYAVSARLEQDASLVVTERITVNIELDAIQHGIYRMYPVRERVGEDGLRHYDFKVLSVALDGNPVLYTESEQAFTVGIAIGDPKKMAPLGRHTYELVYRTAGHVRFLEDHDEIYYNVTGNFWKFPIDHATFTLELPDNAAPILTKAYTGERGMNGTDYQMTGSSSFETTRPLKIGEGLTVVVGWEKGLISQPSQTFANFMGDNRLLVLFGIVLVQMFTFLLLRFVWTYRRKNTVIPLFSAPDGMTPGAAACLKKRNFPGQFLQADILWAAVNGYLRMSLQDKKTIILTKTNPDLKKRSRPLADWIQQRMNDIICSLFTADAPAVIDMRKDKKEKSFVLIDSYFMLKKSYEKKLKGMWKRSRLPGILSAALGLGLLYLAMDKGIYHPGLIMDYYYSADTMLFVQGGIIGLILLFGYGIKKSLALFSCLRRAVGILGAVIMIFLLMVALIVLVVGDMGFCVGFSAIILAAAWAVCQSCARLSDKGSKLDAKIRGLEMYIRTAEKDRLAKINAPEDTLEKYEEILPYACALGCADAWQKRFEPLLRHLDYIPDWIDDEELNTLNIVTYTTVIRTLSMPSELSKTLNAAASEYTRATSGFFSGSSSGTSSDSGYSGGSSGGGSGGGGGGGW